tara:strand:- start:78 stop:419 length:342 start_codon:yes stop_codon:yes gene_type:complete
MRNLLFAAGLVGLSGCAHLKEVVRDASSLMIIEDVYNNSNLDDCDAYFYPISGNCGINCKTNSGDLSGYNLSIFGQDALDFCLLMEGYCPEGLATRYEIFSQGEVLDLDLRRQ